jgi:very-short-patch-repair endonuclease
METRLRMLLVLSGLPKPKVQVTLRDDSGVFLARPDMYFPGHRLVVEYDGATHRVSLAADNRRQNHLIEAGCRILRFTARDVIDTPAAVVSIVRRSLAAPVSSADK